MATGRYIQWVPGDLLLGKKQQEPASDRLAPSGAEVKNSPMCIHICLYLYYTMEISNLVT